MTAYECGNPNARAIFAEHVAMLQPALEALYRELLVNLLREPPERLLAWADLVNPDVLEALMRAGNGGWLRAVEALNLDIEHGYDVTTEPRDRPDH
ncbi:hypothetical protein [Protaetiibacter larvae]|uniref:Uncharacterized protein n=1 Tax=Protaetiibacter larvae TaxID=2592654 RepID=A0A5C1Y6H8_9MICO|nr:hypothetical protein [Protaetiibacter larvae]QEO08805.1 hypothetical protein FLP23_01485 [Protaetiibacter larvae]